MAYICVLLNMLVSWSSHYTVICIIVACICMGEGPLNLWSFFPSFVSSYKGAFLVSICTCFIPYRIPVQSVFQLKDLMMVWLAACWMKWIIFHLRKTLDYRKSGNFRRLKNWRKFLTVAYSMPISKVRHRCVTCPYSKKTCPPLYNCNSSKSIVIILWQAPSKKMMKVS